MTQVAEMADNHIINRDGEGRVPPAGAALVSVVKGGNPFDEDILDLILLRAWTILGEPPMAATLLWSWCPWLTVTTSADGRPSEYPTGLSYGSVMTVTSLPLSRKQEWPSQVISWQNLLGDLENTPSARGLDKPCPSRRQGLL